MAVLIDGEPVLIDVREPVWLVVPIQYQDDEGDGVERPQKKSRRVYVERVDRRIQIMIDSR